MEYEDLDLQLSVAKLNFSRLHYRGALAVAIAGIHYTYLNKMKKKKMYKYELFLKKE